MNVLMGISFLTWKRSLDKLKAEAIARTDEDPKPTDAAIAIAEEAAKKPMAEWMSSVRRAAKDGAAAGLEPPPACTVYGWRVCLSRARVVDRYSWHLSASLSPKGRSSGERDWQMIGKIAAYLGAPRDPLVVPDDPNDAHHWQWLDQSS